MPRIGIGKTDVGAVRDSNEDTIMVINEELGVLRNAFAVADGMGGHNAGDVASQAAVKHIEEFLKRAGTEHGLTPQNLLRDAVAFANSMVFNMSATSEEYKRMGTTVSLCSFDDSNLYYAHVGDSRIYVVRNDVLRQVTDDHSLVNEMIKQGALTADEALTHPRRNVVTRAVGTERSVEVDCGRVPLKLDETVLICSDGLTGMVTDKDILNIITKSSKLKQKEKIIDKLIAAAIKNGGNDNISVVLLNEV